jgi:hypothetical protein
VIGIGACTAIESIHTGHRAFESLYVSLMAGCIRSCSARGKRETRQYLARGLLTVRDVVHKILVGTTSSFRYVLRRHFKMGGATACEYLQGLSTKVGTSSGIARSHFRDSHKGKMSIPSFGERFS